MACGVEKNAPIEMGEWEAEQSSGNYAQVHQPNTNEVSHNWEDSEICLDAKKVTLGLNFQEGGGAQATYADVREG